MDFTVENAGTTIACREYAGPDVSPDTPALVCVHGACVDGTFFDGIACELSRNYRVIAYDRRGCGGSSEAADGSYDLAAQAADLQAVIEHVGAPTNVLAHSAGTLVALELLRTEPHLVDRAILHEPAVSAEGVGMGAAPVLLDMIAAGKVSRRSGFSWEPSATWTPRLLERPKRKPSMPCATAAVSWQTNTGLL